MSASRWRSAEQILWLATYVIVVLAPLALLAVAVKPGAQGVVVVFAAALGFAALSLLVLQALVSGRWAPITAAFGLRSVLSFHRQAGMAALVLVVGHVVALMADDLRGSRCSTRATRPCARWRAWSPSSPSSHSPARRCGDGEPG